MTKTNSEPTVLLLTKSYGPFSAGTRFIQKAPVDQFGEIDCESVYMLDGKHWRFPIPAAYLVEKRHRQQADTATNEKEGSKNG